jgi:hypothetical protein
MAGSAEEATAKASEKGQHGPRPPREDEKLPPARGRIIVTLQAPAWMWWLALTLALTVNVIWWVAAR